jgi:hypothetical protein
MLRKSISLVISVTLGKTLIFSKKMQEGAEMLPSGYLPLPARLEQAMQIIKTHGNAENPNWKKVPYTS